MTFRKNVIFVVVDESARVLTLVDAPKRVRTIRNSQAHLGVFPGYFLGQNKDRCRPNFGQRSRRDGYLEAAVRGLINLASIQE
jgi:hypothetical protein